MDKLTVLFVLVSAMSVVVMFGSAVLFNFGLLSQLSMVGVSLLSATSLFGSIAGFSKS